MNMLTELKNRGILDACIVCCDGLKGLPAAIETTWPQATVQTCVVHLVRNSLRYASKKYWQAITKDLKRIYHSPSVAAAETELEMFAEKWEAQYPAIVGIWRRSWAEFTPFLNFPLEVRKLIYTTNGIESLNARFRATTRRRGHFPDEQSALKVLYLAAIHREHNRPNPTGQIAGWKSILRFAAHGITKFRHVMTDNHFSYKRSNDMADAIHALGAQHIFIKAQCPWQNGKVERLNRTLQTEWAYRQVFTSNDDRTAALAPWLEYYNNR